MGQTGNTNIDLNEVSQWTIKSLGVTGRQQSLGMGEGEKNGRRKKLNQRKVSKRKRHRVVAVVRSVADDSGKK